MSTSKTAPHNQKTKRPPPSLKVVYGDPWCFFGFGLGAGLSPWAPGTLGTLVAIPLYYLLRDLPIEWYLGAVILFFLAGIRICERSEQRVGGSDHSGIVWDEIVGYLITMTAAPLNWTSIVLGFVLFRVFDILKPWPIRRLDQTIHGGLGIMLDDVLAGVFAALVMMLVNRVI